MKYEAPFSRITTYTSLPPTTSSTPAYQLPASTSRRPRLLNILPSTGGRALSPIQSNPTTPGESPGSRPKSTNLSNFLNPLSKLANLTANHSLGKSGKNKVLAKSESRPIYEAESPDELALVDAAYAYNFKLLKRLAKFSS